MMKSQCKSLILIMHIIFISLFPNFRYNGTSSQISSRPAQSLLKLEGHVNDVDTISRQESLYASCKFSEISSPVFCAIPTPRSSANTLIVPPILPDNVIINYCQV